MSISIVKAIKTRWDAKSLGDSVTGGIHHSRAPEGTSMPYCVFTEVSNPTDSETRRTRYNTFTAQFDVYTDDGDPETSADLADAIKSALSHAENAASDPLTPATVDIIRSRVLENPHTFLESDQVYRSTFTMLFDWSEQRTLTPAS